MKMVKSLILGSAAGFIAMSGAQAADLPVKAKAVEYVRICSLYGAGFYYIPGTDTCIKIGGYVHAELQFNGNGVTNGPNWDGNAGQANRLRNQYQYRSRQDLNMDTRTATEYGVVRTFTDVTFTWTGGGADNIAGGSLGVYHAFIQFAGFTLGSTISQFSSPWGPGPGNNTSYLIGGDDTNTGVNQLAYTASFGNGVTASISIEEQSKYRNSQVINAQLSTAPAGPPAVTAATWLAGLGPYAAATAAASPPGGFGGNTVPDIVGQLRVDQAWGLFQIRQRVTASMPATTIPRRKFRVTRMTPTGLRCRDRCRSRTSRRVRATRSTWMWRTRTAQPVTCSAACRRTPTRCMVAPTFPVFTRASVSVPRLTASSPTAARSKRPMPSVSVVRSTTTGTRIGLRPCSAATPRSATTTTPRLCIVLASLQRLPARMARLYLRSELRYRGSRFPYGLDSCEEPLVLGRSALDGSRPEDVGTYRWKRAPVATKPNAPYEFKDQNTVVVGFRARRNF